MCEPTLSSARSFVVVAFPQDSFQTITQYAGYSIIMLFNQNKGEGEYIKKKSLSLYELPQVGHAHSSLRQHLAPRAPPSGAS